jgi:hypothetical protein
MLLLLPCYSGPTTRSRIRGSRCQLARHWESTVNLPLNMAQNNRSWHIGTIQRGINRLVHTAHRGPLDSPSRVLALPLRRVENSSRGVARLSRIGQLNNRAARSPLRAPVAQITRGLGGGNRRILRGDQPRQAAMAGPTAGVIYSADLGSSAAWNTGTFRRCPRPAVCSVANYDAKGPYAANRGGVWPRPKPEHSIQSGTIRSTFSTPRTLRPPREASAAPNTLAAAVHAHLVGPLSLNARTSRPTTHLERHDRLADHRQQPRRQRDQLRRELRVRHTGGDRRRRLPVPCEQHRHEQLEPLRQRIRSFAHARASRQEHEGKARSADGVSACLAACCPSGGTPLEYAVSTP